MPSPLGELLLVGRETADGFALTSLTMPGQRGGDVAQPLWNRDAAPFTEARRQLDAYFAGEATRFDLPLAPRGTPFREQVWRALDRIPYGETLTYRQLAAAAGAPESVRAVGGAVGANPLLVIRPCHRVIGSDGGLTGYAGGLDNKRRLLALEGVAPH
ncbi:cysteine methyltransferase [Wenjunlia vitaminophila]|uniref:Methylated-DNA--protein-cysteine methyltransferase n=2 Tax=Wenjunlia vitaminophila TaxID=76728 RepID=A0A0T6LZQ0_WENVI|nr:cysteine methyltransferase [Wenjunlia vitaminophila]